MQSGRHYHANKRQLCEGTDITRSTG